MKSKPRLVWNKWLHCWAVFPLQGTHAERMFTIARTCAFNQANVTFLHLWDDVRPVPKVLTPPDNRPYRHW